MNKLVHQNIYIYYDIVEQDPYNAKPLYSFFNKIFFRFL